MDLSIYINSSDSKVINKSIRQIGDTYSCSVYGECTIKQPDLLLTYASQLALCNYAYIADFGRYYFKKDLTLLSGGRCILSLEVDPLMSFASDIGNLNCIINRYEKAGISMLPDSGIAINGNSVEIIHFPNGFELSNTHSVVLGVLGGA